MKLFSGIIVLLVFAISNCLVLAATYNVGPDRDYKTPSEVQGSLNDGDIIEIDGGTYHDITVWTKDRLTIRGINGRPHFDSAGISIPNQKATWVIQGDNCIVDNIEFSGADVPDNNGAGIRSEGVNLTVNNSYFHDNEMGILTANDEKSTIIIENSEFHDHGKSNGGYSHNIYIGRAYRFIMKNSYSHHAWHGHNVKSRAEFNYILYNRIMDEETGSSSYLLDLPEGGRSYVIGNLFHQGKNSENYNAALSYASENTNGEFQELYVSGNTFVNEKSNGGGIRYVRGDPEMKIFNNIFVGFAHPMNSPATDQEYFNNIETDDAAELDFRDIENYDYYPGENSIAIDAGAAPTTEHGFDLTPVFEYGYPGKLKKRDINYKLDTGAIESEFVTDPCIEDNILCVGNYAGMTHEYSRIQDAVDDVSPGDTILILPGTYNIDERIFMDVSGTPDKPITIKGYGKVIIDGSNLGTGDRKVVTPISVDFADNVIVENLEIRNCGYHCIRVSWSDNVTIRNCNFHDSEEYTVSVSYSQNCQFYNNTVHSSKDSHCVYFGNSLDHSRVHDNIIYDCNSACFQNNADPRLRWCTEEYIYDWGDPVCDGITTDLIFERNILHDCHGGSAINLASVSESIFRNNIVYDTERGGIAMWDDWSREDDYPPEDHYPDFTMGAYGCKNNIVANNIIHIKENERRNGISLSRGSNGNTIINNIFITGVGYPIKMDNYSVDQELIDNNIYYRQSGDYVFLMEYDDRFGEDDYESKHTLSELRSMFGMDSHSKEVPPEDIFADFGTRNLHHKKDGEGVDSGRITAYVTHDINMVERPQNSYFDIGAYEYDYQQQPCSAFDTSAPIGVLTPGEIMNLMNRLYSGEITIAALIQNIIYMKDGC